MTSGTRLFAATILAASAGCSLLSGPPKAGGLGGGGEAGEYSGLWTREGEGGLQLHVNDDGDKVTGEMVQGEGFAAYSIDLARRPLDGKLSGKARFELAEMPGKTFENEWLVAREGSALRVECDEMEIDLDTGEVFERKPGGMTFAFAQGASPTPAGGGDAGGDAGGAGAAPAIDMSAYVTPLPTYKHYLAEGIAVGQWIEVETATEVSGVPPQPATRQRTAVVGETSDAWILEQDNQVNQKDTLLAVFVDKESGRTLKAYVGTRGKEAKEKEVPPLQEQPTEGLEGEDVEVTVEAGTFAAKYYEVQGSKSWTGVEGDAEGVLLKSEHSAGGDELKQLDAGASYSAAGTDYPCKHLVYTSGNEMWFSPKDGAPPLNQLLLRLLVKTPQMTSETKLVGAGDDAQPEMEYPR